MRFGGYTSSGVLMNDANGVISSNTTLVPQVTTNTAAITAIQSVNTTQTIQITALQTLTTSQGTLISALQAGQTALNGQVNTLFDLQRVDRRDIREGVAAAVGMGHAPMASAAGRTSYVVNVSTFRGEQALGGSIMHRIGGEMPLAVGVSSR